MSEHEIEPVEGEVFPVSARKALLLIGLAMVVVPVGVGLTWLWVSDTTISLINKRITWWGGLMGAVMAIAGVLLPPIILWKWLIRKERLVIGSEFLQVLITKGGQDIVKKQISFTNIKSATPTKHFDSTVIGIQLRDVDDPDLIPSGGETLEKFKENFGFHLYLEDAYQLPAKDICRRIKKAAGLGGKG